MTLLFFDAESSGLMRDGLPDTDPSQPRLLQLAARLTDNDGKRLHSFAYLIRPEGWSIEVEAEKVHGISERRAHRFGIPVIEVLRAFRILVPMARHIVGHGIQNFDRRLITGELHRLKAKGDWWNRGADMIDTVEMTTPMLKLPGDFGHKFPTLAEAHDFFFPAQAPYVATHDAEDDLLAVARVYFAARAHS